MAIQGSGIRFYPLYWVFHDQWKYYIPNGNYPVIHDHWGHLHFWMMGFDPAAGWGDAFAGQQRFQFEMEDVWGPRSTDPNQSDLYRIVGTPKWYYRVTELWRRVFVQPWDEKVEGTAVATRRGVKYDASPQGEEGLDDADGMNQPKTMGPFREGRANHGLKNWVPFWMKGARSLPVDHYTSGARSQAQRQNHLADLARSMLGAEYDDAKYNLRHGNMLVAKSAGGHPAGVPPFSDAFYIWPVIEYQKVVQLDWEPLPDSKADVANPDDATDDYGDGWQTEVVIPFVDPATGRYRSPFALYPGVVLPFGQYNELQFPSGRKLVPADRRLRHAEYTYDAGHPYTSPLDLPPERSGKPLTEWHNPYGADAGGAIVQQCLGGVVQARAKVILEHKLGGRREVWTDTIQYVPSTPFEGTDQASPPPAV